MRLGFLTHVEGGRNLAESYANAVELFVAADELGFDSGWVAQHHFSDDPTSGLPSPWVFLAHVAARTTSIRIGTAVTLASIEDPIRLAEDVGVVDILSGGRVELGVGSGFGESTFRVFGRDHERRRELTTDNFARVRAALRGEPLDSEGTVIKPVNADLADNRSWHAVFSANGAGHVAAEGANLLLNRAAYGYDEPTDVVQRPWADRYLADWNQPRPPRIGLSRLIFPAADRAESLRHLGDGLLSAARRMNLGGQRPRAQSRGRAGPLPRLLRTPGRGGRCVAAGARPPGGDRAAGPVQSRQADPGRVDPGAAADRGGHRPAAGLGPAEPSTTTRVPAHV